MLICFVANYVSGLKEAFLALEGAVKNRINENKQNIIRVGGISGREA